MTERTTLPDQTTPNPIEIVGQRVRLKPFAVKDAPQIFALIDRNRPHLPQHHDPTAEKYKSVEAVIESIENPNPRRSRFGIWNQESQLVGSINIEVDENESTKAEVGYYLGSE